MTWMIPLPRGARALAQRNSHPGLLLDKFAASWNEKPGNEKFSEHVQRPTVQAVAELSGKMPPGLDYAALLARHRNWQRHLGCRFLAAATTGPLTLHLSRASSLENAGICLHPIYGFAYLPGSGLKGMAHAYACEVWLPAQPDRNAAWENICKVFGAAPAPWLAALAESLDRRFADGKHVLQGPKDASAGEVVFHDAWPAAWPALTVDIVNCHYSEYYGASDDGNVPPPGDWENPVPVYFLALPAGVTFEFALGKRRAAAPDEFLQLASVWLAGALCHLGAGAKTNAGYGAFELAPATDESLRHALQADWQNIQSGRAQGMATSELKLELVTPAFLAGALQNTADCDLRPATLRGLLRWWWRTMHAAHVDAATLRRLESALWGDTKAGGAVRISVHRIPDAPGDVVPTPFKKPGRTKTGGPRLDFDEQFAQQHDIQLAPPRTTQPLAYLAYGMDELVDVGGKKHRRQRFCMLPGAKWRIRLTASDVTLRAGPSGSPRQLRISAKACLEQAQAALRLLGLFGGVGSKARKGFGSVRLTDDALPSSGHSNSLESILQTGRKFREQYGVSSNVSPASKAGSPALDEMKDLSRAAIAADFLEIPTPWKNPWFALDQLGAAFQAFTQAPKSTGHGKHCEAKRALGLPRKIHGPLEFKLPHQQSHTPPKALSGPKGDRHAAPVHFHFDRSPDGSLVIRVAAFPSAQLPNVSESKRLLDLLLKHLFHDLSQRIKKFPSLGQKWSSASATSAGRQAGAKAAAPPPQSPKAGDHVEAVLLAEKTKSGGWRARHEATGLSGPIQNSNAVPADKTAGDRLTLRVKYANPREIAFEYPVAQASTQAKPPRKN